jgi:hypothetical protein
MVPGFDGLWFRGSIVYDSGARWCWLQGVDGSGLSIQGLEYSAAGSIPLPPPPILASLFSLLLLQVLEGP